MTNPGSYLCVFLLLLAGCDFFTPGKNTWRLEVVDPASNSTHVIQQADVTHKLVVINYWAEWCKPCREEIPELNRFAATHADTAVVLGFNFDNLADAPLRASIKTMGIAFPVLVRNPAGTFVLPEINGLPTTVILNSNGKLKTTLLGSQTVASLEAALSAP